MSYYCKAQCHSVPAEGAEKVEYVNRRPVSPGKFPDWNDPFPLLFQPVEQETVAQMEGHKCHTPGRIHSKSMMANACTAGLLCTHLNQVTVRQRVANERPTHGRIPANTQPTHGRYTHSQFMDDAQPTQCRHTPSRLTSDTQPSHGQHTAHSRTTHCPLMANALPTHEQNNFYTLKVQSFTVEYCNSQELEEELETLLTQSGTNERKAR